MREKGDFHCQLEGVLERDSSSGRGVSLEGERHFLGGVSFL